MLARRGGADGNFYGTTTYGGANDAGEVFQITPAGAFTVLYSFGTALGDTFYPLTLLQATDGNFYGATNWSGSHSACSFIASTGVATCGTIFKLTPTGTLTTLHLFSDGSAPDVLFQGSDGNLYGTTASGGTSTACIGGCGTVFKIGLAGAFTCVYNFNSSAISVPTSLVQGSDGNFYGTVTGPMGSNGAVFRFAPASVTTTTAPTISPTGGILSGASFQPGISPGSWITIEGTNFSTITDTWTNTIVNGELPLSLDGVTLTVSGAPAYIYYLSSAQINAIAPNVGPGTIQVTVSTPSGTSTPVTAVSQAEQPAFFQWGTYAVATTQSYALAVKNGTFSVTTTPAKPGDVIILWGTGFGPTSPLAPVGALTPTGTTYNTATPVTVTVGGVAAPVYGAALASGYAGLYQVAIQIPTSLQNGDYPVVATIDGVSSPSTTLITVQK